MYSIKQKLKLCQIQKTEYAKVTLIALKMTEKSGGKNQIWYNKKHQKHSSGGDYYFYETDFNCHL